jgi:CelD/BcsL family acetyltransferase involved in cellulose biosynthesis
MAPAKGPAVHLLDPLEDPRWNKLVARHPAASVFHTSGWLDALRRTHGYEPIVYTTCPPGAPLTNGIVLCRVRSWLTGRRLVSVPFADHCDPLVESRDELSDLLAALRAEVGREWSYVELRPTRTGPGRGLDLEREAEFQWHVVDLRPPLTEIFQRAHKSTIRCKIARGGREGLRFEEGRSDALVRAFYRLMLLTRRRHGRPPQSLRWFSNLVDCLGDRATIRVAFSDGRAVGSMMTLAHGRTLVYKYGCSDARFHHLGVMPSLFWRAIEDARAAGFQAFDLGRSDSDNEGLITFKERLGAVGSKLTYFRFARPGRGARRRPFSLPAGLLARLPDPLFVTAGRLLYRHVG